jgi:hypothetical protein
MTAQPVSQADSPVVHLIAPAVSIVPNELGTGYVMTGSPADLLALVDTLMDAVDRGLDETFGTVAEAYEAWKGEAS